MPDQLRTGVGRPCRYEPGLQRTYAEWARHYDTVIIPARPRAPRDKAKVEAAVLVAERWILARLRHEVFHTLGALNARIRELLTWLNDRPMRSYGGQSRRALFERFDRPALRPLPTTRYEHADWRQARVNIDYHLDVEHHLYSVPHQLFGEQLDVRVTATMIDIYRRGARVYVHRRSFAVGGFTTIPEHMPKAHRAHLEWSPTRLINWGATDRPADGGAGERDSREPPAPGAGLPLVSGPAPAQQAVPRRPRWKRPAPARCAPAPAPTARWTTSSSTGLDRTALAARHGQSPLAPARERARRRLLRIA